MGVVVCFAPKDLNTIGSGISMNLSVTPYAEFNASELKKISCNYMYKMPFTEVSIQVGSDSYGAQQGPPTANRELNSWLQAKEHVL